MSWGGMSEIFHSSINYWKLFWAQCFREPHRQPHRYKVMEVFQFMLLVFGSGIKLISYTFSSSTLCGRLIYICHGNGVAFHLTKERDKHLNSSLPIGSMKGTSILEVWFISCQSRSVVPFPKSVHCFPGRYPAPLQAVSPQTLSIWWDVSHPLSFRACLHCTLQSYLRYKLVRSYITMQKS